MGRPDDGGRTLPGAVAGTIALDELVLHGWDLARGLGQPFTPTSEDIEACTGFVAEMSTLLSREGLFGPVLPVSDEASPWERLLLLSGRDPNLELGVAGGDRTVPGW